MFQLAARRPALFAIAEGEGEQPMRLCLGCRISPGATKFNKRIKVISIDFRVDYESVRAAEGH